MSEGFITCPHCGKEIQLTEALTGEVEQKLRMNFDEELRKRQLEMETRMGKLQTEAEKKAKESLSLELSDLCNQLDERDKKLEDAQKQELELRKRQRDIEERENKQELEIARKMDEERKKIELETALRVSEENRVKDLEKERQFNDLKRQIDEWKRKAEQGSQQTQGEAVELELEELLRQNFPYDQIEPVGKGVKGADICQRVHNYSGQLCGTIIWESKNTKTWSDGWIDKLKEDQRTEKAEIAGLLTIALPKGVSHFTNINGVWVTDFSTFLAVSGVLRTILLQVAQTKIASEGISDKKEMLYSYLSGNEFKQRVEAIVESFSTMKGDLDREKRAIEKSWAAREKQIDRVIRNVGGMYGDMEGIIGASLPKIASLELPSGDGYLLEGE
jgi:hypothetical protein